MWLFLKRNYRDSERASEELMLVASKEAVGAAPAFS